MHRRALRITAGCFALALALLGHAKADPSPSLLKTGQPTCNATPSILIPAQPGKYQMVTIEQMGTVGFYLGPAGVTTANGFLIPPVVTTNQNPSYTGSISADVWCVTASGSASIAIIQPIGAGS